MRNEERAQDERQIRMTFWLAIVMVLAGALLRLAPHPPNVAPVGAMALFGGSTLVRARWAPLVPMGAMLLSDVLLELAGGRGFHPFMPVVYGAFASVVWIGRRLGPRPGVLRIVAGSVAGSTVFFIVTNFAVWVSSGMYPHTVSGLLTCYVAALPFYGATLAGDLGYNAVMFGTFAVARFRLAPRMTVA